MDIIKAFKNNESTSHVTIRGTHEEPLLRASDVGVVLGITNIHTTIKDFDNSEKVIHTIDTLGGPQDVTFLTEKGLYKLLFRSRKPIAKQFTDWVCEVIKEIRLKGKYELEQQLIDSELKLQLKDIENEDTLINSFDNKHVVYLILIKKNVIKFGFTNDIKRRRLEHRTKYGLNIVIKMIFETKYNRELEQMIKIHLKKHIIDIDPTQTELIQLSDEFTYEHLKKEIDLLKRDINNSTVPHLIKEVIKESTKELTNENSKLKAQLEVYKNDKQVKEFDKLQSDNKLLIETSISNEKELTKLRTITSNKSIITSDQLKHISIDENIYKEFIEKRLTIGITKRCALSQLCKDFHTWSKNETIFINGRYKIKFKEELMNYIVKITGINKSSGMNITDKSKGIKLTKCIGFEGIGIKEIENNYVHMYDDNIYTEYLEDKIIVTNVVKDKITIREILDVFMIWMTDKDYEINKKSIGKTLYSEIFMKEFINFVTTTLNVEYNLTGRKKYNGIKCSGYFIGLKII